MYYRDCTKAWAAEFVKEILENAEPWKAMELVEAFILNQMNTDEIGNEF